MKLTTPIENKSLREKVYEIIKDKIMTNEFLPGEALNVVALAEALGASQTPVREAMNMLRAEGLIHQESHRKCLVAPIESDDVLQAYEVRLLIEPYAAYQAADSIKEKTDLKKLLDALRTRAQAIMEQPENEVDLDGYLRIDLDLHEIFLAAAGDALLGEVLNLIGDRSRRIRTYFEGIASKFGISSTHKIHEITSEHLEIIKAIQRGQAQTAKQLLHRHLLNGQARTLDMMKFTQSNMEKKRTVSG